MYVCIVCMYCMYVCMRGWEDVYISECIHVCMNSIFYSFTVGPDWRPSWWNGNQWLGHVCMYECSRVSMVPSGACVLFSMKQQQQMFWWSCKYVWRWNGNKTRRRCSHGTARSSTLQGHGHGRAEPSRQDLRSFCEYVFIVGFKQALLKH